MKKHLLFVLALLLAYLLFFPVAIDPMRWEVPTNAGFTGSFTSNQRLVNTQYRFSGQCYKCEDVAVDALGQIYGGSERGEIVRFDTKGQREVLVNTGGRPLGLDFDPEGNLWIADADQGLLCLDTNLQLTTHSTTYQNKDFAFTDDLEVGADGIIYFSDASWKFGIKDYKLDLLEHRPNGRLLAYDPATRTTSLLLDSLYFANGIAVAEDASFVLVNETGKYRVKRYWLQGAKKASVDILIDNLPGFPDGISRGTQGVFWLAFTSPRQAKMDFILERPFLRKILVRLPSFVQPKPNNYSFLIGLDQNGKVLYNLQDPAGAYAQIASVQQWGKQLYLGSLYEDGIGVYELE